MQYIYKITNKITGEIYIGRTTDVRRRMWEHNSHRNSSKKEHLKMYESMNKYGIENFEITMF